MKKALLCCLVTALLATSANAQFTCWCAFITDYLVAQQSNKQVKISWKADSELGTAKDFVIERSYTGLTTDMVAIGYVSANPNATLTSYTFYDAYPCNGTATHAYYRIRSENVNGDKLYTSIQAVALNGCPSGCTVPNTCRCNLNTLTGPTSICSGSAVYEVTNASGPVTWSVSNSSIASVSQNSSTRATVTMTGNGTVTVTAAISGCTSLTRTVTLGGPSASPSYLIKEYEACIGGSDWEASFQVQPAVSGVTYLWSVNGGPFTAGPANYSFAQSLDQSITLDVKFQNACGTSSSLAYPPTYYTPCPFFRAALSPNPAKNYLVVSIEEIQKNDVRAAKNDNLEASIYDFNTSVMLRTQKGTGKQMRLNTRMLKPGKYVLHITYRGQKVVQQVLIK